MSAIVEEKQHLVHPDVPPGVYLCEVDASEFTTTRCVMIYQQCDQKTFDDYIKSTPPMFQLWRDRIVVGFVTWDKKSNELEIIHVMSGCRRKGFAKTLLAYADQIAGCTLIDNGYRNEVGRKFLKALGRKLAKKKGSCRKEVGYVFLFDLQRAMNRNELPILSSERLDSGRSQNNI